MIDLHRWFGSGLTSFEYRTIPPYCSRLTSYIKKIYCNILIFNPGIHPKTNNTNMAPDAINPIPNDNFQCIQSTSSALIYLADLL